MRSKKNATVVLLIAAVLSFGSAVPAFAADSSTAPPSNGSSSSTLSTGSAPSLGTVSLNGGSFFELKNVIMLTEQKGKTVTFTVSVHNESSTDLLFIDYWVHVLTKSGNQISVRVLPQDKDKNKISAKSVQDINFYAALNETTELNDLMFEFIKWDFSQPNFERKIGDIAVPDNYSTVTPADDSHAINMTGTEVKTSIKKVLLTKNEKNYSPTVILNMENIGNRSAKVPGYQYLLRTAEGYMYPLDAKKNKELTINPQVKEEVELSGSVPIAVSTEGWQLVIVQESAELKLNLPIAYFQLPPVSATDTVATGIEYNFSNKKGTYTTKLNSFQRLPWEDQDILAANITLLNKGVEALPIPDLAGYFMLDDNVKVEAKLIKTDKTIGLAKGASANFQFIGKMPYTYEFTTVKLVLEEKTSETEKEELLEFAHSSELLNIPYLNVGETHKMTNVGRNASYNVRSIKTYSGDTADIFTVQLEATNLEKRFTDISKLVAQFKTTDGTVYPAAVSEIKKKIGPNASALLFLSGTLPRGFQSSNVHIMIGEAVTDDKYTEKDAVPDAYVNAAAFWLPNENRTVQDDLMNVDILPYTFSMNHINTWLLQGQLKLTFNYELTKNLLMESNTEGRKLIIGLEDENGNKTFSREFDFKDFDTSDSIVESTGDDVNITKLKLGKHDGVKIIERDQDLIYKLETLKTYKLSIYDSFQGQKKLLATKKIDWFSTTD
ncbi:hypothetical protein [Paenibacillus radicis (ex Xue et al. 2023)]|uniref:Uncharacterized protein n=1 Tax=Paenibacillus radicis (ex Xue et al. 2023) TaxID=2972489 RepID=A0ABT1YNZ3_9BACL|nr:hypothetical protein [Paenibacillus radicis (ex Xue et al. 2023)]MCR8634901.1 hypothetical protein [Paenibacillus radicis (ex Xue et al. 2023)]